MSRIINRSLSHRPSSNGICFNFRISFAGGSHRLIESSLTLTVEFFSFLRGNYGAGNEQVG